MNNHAIFGRLRTSDSGVVITSMMQNTQSASITSASVPSAKITTTIVTDERALCIRSRPLSIPGRPVRRIGTTTTIKELLECGF